MTDLSTTGSLLVGACSMLREDPSQRESDWITIALRTIRLLDAERATLAIAEPSQIKQALRNEDVSLKRYARDLAGSLIHLVSQCNVALADEIAHSAERATRQHNLFPEIRYANAG